jgi:hypothetical protein
MFKQKLDDGKIATLGGRHDGEVMVSTLEIDICSMFEEELRDVTVTTSYCCR